MAVVRKADPSLTGAIPLPQARPKNRRRLGVLVAGALLLLIAAIVAAAVYYNQIRPWRTTVLVVDGKTTSMDYFLKRVRMSGQEPLAVLQALSFEEIVRQIAPAPPFDIAVSDADIDAFIEETARGASAGISAAELAEWQRQQLNDTSLSEAEFRQLQRTRLLIRQLRDRLAAGQPTTGEQVRLRMIVQPTLDAGKAVKARLDAGEDFSTLADELNTDPEERGKGGDLGWRSRAGLTPELAGLVFDSLAAGQPSDPVKLAEEAFAILLVTGREANRPIAADELETIRSAEFQDWLQARFREHRIEYHGFRNGYDSETDAWVKAQIARMNELAGKP